MSRICRGTEVGENSVSAVWHLACIYSCRPLLTEIIYVVVVAVVGIGSCASFLFAKGGKPRPGCI